MTNVQIDNPSKGKGKMIIGVIFSIIGIFTLDSIGVILLVLGIILIIIGKIQHWFFN